MRKLLAISFFFLAVACTKDSANTDESATAGPKLSRILVGGNVYEAFGYDSKGRLISTTGYLGGMKSHESTATYDNNGHLIKVENSFNISSSTMNPLMDKSYSEFSYSAEGRLVETKTYRVSGGSSIYASRSVPEYDANGRTIAVTIYDPANGFPASKTTYTYNAANNVTVSELFQYNAGIQGPTNRWEYEYDNQKNPYRGQWVMPFGINTNNITKTTGTNFLAVPGVAAGTTASLIVYKNYNGDGYPTLVSDNGVDYVYEYR